MAEGSKARLVRCPKCRNLLTELPDFSVYKCGACGVVLRAKKKAVNGKESDEDSYEKLDSLTENEGGISMNPSEPERENYRDRVFRQRSSDLVTNTSSSVDKNGNRRMMLMMKDKQKGFDRASQVPHTTRTYMRPPKHQHVDELRMMGSDGRGECSSTSNAYSYGYGKIRRDHAPLDGAIEARIANLEHDRAELLRKVGELNQQLNYSCVHYTVPGNGHVCDSSCLKQYGHHRNEFEMEMGNGDFRMPSPLHNKAMNPAPVCHSQQQSPRGYFSSSFSPRSQETLCHQQPAAYSCSIAAPSHGCNSIGNGYGFHPRDPQIHARWQGVGGFQEDHRPQRDFAVKRKKRHWHPIANGAPLIACCACFELLKLPGKTVMQEQDKVKMRCGCCSAVLMVQLRSRKLMVSVCEDNTESNAVAIEVHENGVNVCETSGDLGHVEVTGTNLREMSLPAEEQMLTSQSEKTKKKKKKDDDVSSSSSSSFGCPSVSSEEDEILDDVVVLPQVSSVEKDESPSMRTLHYLENSNGSSEPLNLPAKGDRITHTRDRGNDSRITSRQSSWKDASSRAAAREEEFSFNDYVNMDSSIDSIDTSKSKSSPMHKWIETSLAGVFKKSLRDFAKPPLQPAKKNKKPNVFVNGQPIYEDTLRMAEKLAGPIHHGDYWYDFRAGFWGVMGQPCLGVIPPFIEEFHYPMPRNCAAGNTGVYVNGRELHQQDLELLCKRGLPIMKHKFYTIETDGRLYDNDSGKELHGIGKLAPTVEKVKRGFGMRVPSDSVVE